MLRTQVALFNSLGLRLLSYGIFLISPNCTNFRLIFLLVDFSGKMCGTYTLVILENIHCITYTENSECIWLYMRITETSKKNVKKT